MGTVSGYNPGSVAKGNIAKPNLNTDFSNLKALSTNYSAGTGVVNSSTNNSSVVSLEMDLSSILYDGGDDITSMGLEGSVPPIVEKNHSLLGSLAATIGATAVVGFTSIFSGVLKLGEKLVDGAAHIAVLGATAASALGIDGADDLARDLRDFIAVDQVAKFNQDFYENSELGRAINEASAMKYDSKLAMGIQDFAEDAATIAMATALSTVTGGMAGPLVLGCGFLAGSGSSAQNQYQKGDYSAFDELQILGNGLLTSLSWQANAALGKGYLSLGKDMVGTLGVKGTVTKVCKDVLNPEFVIDSLVSYAKPVNLLMTGMSVAGDVGGYLTGEREFNFENVSDTLWTATRYYALGAFKSSWNTYIKEYDLIKVTHIDVSSEAAKFKDGTIPAADIVKYDKKAQQELLKSMEKEDIAKLFKSLGNDKVPQLYSLLDSTKQQEVLQTIADDVSSNSATTISDVLVYGNNFTQEVINKIDPNSRNQLLDSIVDDYRHNLTQPSEIIKLSPSTIADILFKLNPTERSNFHRILRTELGSEKFKEYAMQIKDVGKKALKYASDDSKADPVLDFLDFDDLDFFDVDLLGDVEYDGDGTIAA